MITLEDAIKRIRIEKLTVERDIQVANPLIEWEPGKLI